MMKRALTLTSLMALIAGLGACDIAEFQEPISLTPHGEAFRHNMAVQIINPNPPAVTPALTSATRPVLAQQAYEIGEVPEPDKKAASPSTAQVQ